MILLRTMTAGLTRRIDIITRLSMLMPAPVILHCTHRLKYRAITANAISPTTVTNAITIQNSV